MDEWEKALAPLKAEYVRESRPRLIAIARSLERLALEPESRGALHDLTLAFHNFSGTGTTYGFPEVTALGREGERVCTAIIASGARPAADQVARGQELLRLLEKELSGGAATASGNTVPPAAPRGYILIVDDDPTLVRLLVHMVEQEGLSAHGVGSKAEAMRAIGERMPDGCIVDIRLPDGSGYELVKTCGRSRAVRLARS